MARAKELGGGIGLRCCQTVGPGSMKLHGYWHLIVLVAFLLSYVGNYELPVGFWVYLTKGRAMGEGCG